MKWPPKAVLEALADTAWPILTAHFNPDCCIAATRIGIRVLQRFGVAAQPLITWPLAGNAPFVAWIKNQSEGVDSGPPKGTYYLDMDVTKAAGLTPEGRRTWHGHLVIAGKVQGVHFVLDLTAGQFHRPEKQIFISEPMLFFTEGKPLVDDGNGEMLAVTLPESGILAYRKHPNPDMTWQDSPDWDIRPRYVDTYNEICGAMVAAVEAKLAPQTAKERPTADSN